MAHEINIKIKSYEDEIFAHVDNIQKELNEMKKYGFNLEMRFFGTVKKHKMLSFEVEPAFTVTTDDI